MINNLISFFTRRKQERGPTFRDMHLTIVSLLKENINLRADNKKLREALKPFAKLKPVSWSLENDHYFIDTNDIRRASAALEGVTEKEGSGNE